MVHPHHAQLDARIATRSWRQFACGLCLLILPGCMSRSMGPEALNKPMPVLDPQDLQLVSDFTRPWGTRPIKVEGVSLAVGLAGTGGDSPPSAERAILLGEMQTRDVDRPNKVLASRTTALVVVRGLLPPGARKGDHFDLEVTVPARSECTSLQGGWLMPTRMTEFAVLDRHVATGHLLALARGDVLVDALLEGSNDAIQLSRGHVLGGGVVAKPRDLGLIVRDEFASVKTSAQLGAAINRRFHVYANGSQRGVANPKRDNFLELKVHPRYQDNIFRYVRVIQNIPVRESATALAQRLDVLESRLMHPPTAAQAALQLEAIGEQGIPALLVGLQSDSAEIRFYAAEALAYLDQPEAAVDLAEIARREPAFRYRALAALGAMDGVGAAEELVELLHVDSSETRYGAFRILRELTPDDPVIAGEVVDDRFHLHVVSTTGPPLVHVSRYERPEIVLFGTDHPLREPVTLFAGTDIVVRSRPNGQIAVRRPTADDDDKLLEVAPQLEAVLRAIVELKGTYPDVVQAISEAKRTGALDSRLEFSAVPRLNRTYHRDQTDAESEASPPAEDLSQELDLASEDLPSPTDEPLIPGIEPDGAQIPIDEVPAWDESALPAEAPHFPELVDPAQRNR